MKRVTITGERFRQLSSNLLCYALLLCIVFLVAYPLVEHLTASFQSPDDLMDESVIFVAKAPTAIHYRTVIRLMEYGRALANTTFLSLASALLQTVSCLLIGYGFARFDFPLKKIWFGMVLLTMIVPIQVIVTSLFMNFRFTDFFGIIEALRGEPLNLIDTYWPFLLLSVFGIGFKNGLYIYLFRQFFRGVPNELEEAGMIDGCRAGGVFWRIMLPNASAIMITVFLFSFSWQWTDNYYTSIFFKETWVLSVAMNFIKTYQRIYMDPVVGAAWLSAGLLLVIAPLLLLYIVLQRFFVQGLARSGIVG